MTEKGQFMVAYLQYSFINPFFFLVAQWGMTCLISLQEKETNHMKCDIQLIIHHAVFCLHDTFKRYVNVLLTSSVKVCLFSNADLLLIH